MKKLLSACEFFKLGESIIKPFGGYSRNYFSGL